MESLLSSHSSQQCWCQWQYLLTSFTLHPELSGCETKYDKNKIVLYHCHGLGSSLAAQLIRKCLCFSSWMQMVLKIESKRYKENVKSSSNWSHLHFLPVLGRQSLTWCLTICLLMGCSHRTAQIFLLQPPIGHTVDGFLKKMLILSGPDRMEVLIINLLYTKTPIKPHVTK